MPANKWPSKYCPIMHRRLWRRPPTLWYTQEVISLSNDHFWFFPQKEKVQSAQVYDIYSLDFDDMDWSDKETCLATVRMFIEMNFVEYFQIPYEVLCRWVLSIKKNYRPVSFQGFVLDTNLIVKVIYHNWRHGLNVAQSMFVMLTVRIFLFITSYRNQFVLSVDLQSEFDNVDERTTGIDHCLHVS